MIKSINGTLHILVDGIYKDSKRVDTLKNREIIKNRVLPKLYKSKSIEDRTEFTSLQTYGDYVLDITKNQRSSFSQKEVLRQFKKIVKIVGDIDIISIKPSIIAKWQNQMLESHSSKTVRNYRSVFNMILDFAYKDEIINRNPIQMIKAPKKDAKTKRTYYNFSEINLLLKKCVNPVFQNILQFFFFSGVRGGEGLALKWSDIDFKDNIILIQRSVREGQILLPKGDKTRYIYLLPQAREALKRQLSFSDSDFVFLNQYNKPYNSTDSLNKQFKKLCRACDLRIGVLYETRRSFATLMLQHSQSEVWITQQLGHYDFSTTKEHYLAQIRPNIEAIENLKL